MWHANDTAIPKLVKGLLIGCFGSHDSGLVGTYRHSISRQPPDSLFSEITVPTACVKTGKKRVE